jgi:G3E family GTPase
MTSAINIDAGDCRRVESEVGVIKLANGCVCGNIRDDLTPW